MGFMIPFSAQLLTLSCFGTTPMSGRLVPAATLSASCRSPSRVVRMWTVTPCLSWNGLTTSLNALSSWPPQATQMVTSVDDPDDDVPPLVPPQLTSTTAVVTPTVSERKNRRPAKRSMDLPPSSPLFRLQLHPRRVPLAP